jgi:hypothetical protein
MTGWSGVTGGIKEPPSVVLAISKTVLYLPHSAIDLLCTNSTIGVDLSLFIIFIVGCYSLEILTANSNERHSQWRN